MKEYILNHELDTYDMQKWLNAHAKEGFILKSFSQSENSGKPHDMHFTAVMERDIKDITDASKTT